LDEGSARHSDFYLTTYNIHNRQINIPQTGFEPASEWPQMHALDIAASAKLIPVFLNRRAEARYPALASILPGHERPEESIICYKI
jgi:hypothetical protein